MGSRLGYLKANVEFGLRDDKLNNEFKKYLKEIVENL
jgi:UTP-glucose-1-phosphate uridylyltransferase